MWIEAGMKKTLFSVILSAGLCVDLLAADSPVVFNEIMYHPQTNEPALEWVELQNQMSVDIDISGWSLDGGIEFRFGEGTIIRGGGYLVIALSPAALMAASGLPSVLGPFSNRLSNAGEQLRLRDNNDRVMDDVTYGVEGDWPVAPDGAGPSLARRRPNVAGADARNWQSSAQVGGTPGAANFPIRPPTIATNTLLAIEGSWSFDDSGADLGTAWRDPGYDDSGWRSGAALFFQEDAPLPASKGTALTPGRVTYYFRSSFAFTDEVNGARLQLRAIIDDGAVGYLNGGEIFRINMPSGTVDHFTLASGQVGDAAYGETIVLLPDHLLSGTNILAVELHQAPTFVAYPQAVLNSSPVAYWRLGESEGFAIDSASVPDAPQWGSQNGVYSGFSVSNLGQAGPRPADFVNAQMLIGFEANNAAPRFAGNSSGGEDVIAIADSDVFNFASVRRFTLEAWVNGAPAQEDGAAIVAKGTGGGGEQFAIDIVGGRYRFFCWDGGVPNTPVVASASIGPNGTWQHIVGVLDQSAGRMKIYVNGSEVGSAAPRPTLLSHTHEVSIGARKNSGAINYNLNFDGRIDEVAIYDRALSTNEIFAHFNAAFTNNAASGPDTNDAVFGLEMVAARTLLEPKPDLIAFNELAAFTNSAFWLELINYGGTNVDLGGWLIMHFDDLTNHAYTLPPAVLAPGELLQVTRLELGFDVDSGERLVLYGPGRSNVLDAVVAKKEPRARSPDGTGAWWFPSTPTPGASNHFVFRDELVINEIMFHHRELASEPPIFSPTNVLVTISNTWRYSAEGVDPGAGWQMPGYDDSAWLSSAAVFYAPTNPFTLPAPKNTLLPLTNRAGSRIVAFYFRAQFLFSGETNGLMLGLHPIIDDGAVFYLNGVEVYRLNMPATNITYGTLASANVGIPGYTGPIVIPAGLLAQGLNTLAVELHQFSPTSSDVDFGTELLAWSQLRPALPFRDSPESWVEIFNRSSNAMNLTGWRLDEGIDYRFPSEKILSAGGYLIVAKDPAYMRSLYPGIDVVGPFTNKLSKHSDYFVLKDANNNPADEVRYFDDDPWPEYADGGGSSLELRDPDADNTKAEAWAASDETGKSSWQTYTWRGVAAAGQTGEPTLWHELALCLIDGAGEVLLDDISVIETPATMPKQLLGNGRFDAASTAHWRFLGNHRSSRVEPEPGDPDNFVLHLIATGPGEYQGNQIETTLSNNVALVNGREYEVSYRARWLGGSSKLNARLYFNRLARTVDLAVPQRNGTPGAPNSRFAKNIGPTFGDFGHFPAVPNVGQPVTVSVAANDPDGLASVTLRYSIAGSAWQEAPMALGASRLDDLAIQQFNGTLPGTAAGTMVQFYVEAVDGLGAAARYPARGTNSRALYVVQDNQAIAGPLHNFRLVMTAADATFLHTGTNTLSNELLGCTVIYDERDTFYDVGVRLKGSFVGRNVARVGYHLAFNPDQPFRGVHEVVSVDRAQHTLIGGLGEVVVKHIASHAGGIPAMHDDIARFIGPFPAYTGTASLRLSGFDGNYLDAQFQNGSDGSMFEVEVLRWNNATVNGNPESPKQVGNESGGTGYANLEVRNYGDDEESYRWFLLLVNNRAADDFAQAIAWCKTLSLTGTNLDAVSRQVMDVDQWLRVMAYQALVGPADAYFTGANIHNFRIYVRPEDQRVLYLPWDWDSSFLLSPTAPIIGTGNISNLLNIQNNRRAYLNHMFDLVTTTFNTAYMARWTAHYGVLGRQDLSGVLAYIGARATYVTGQLPTAIAFAITNNNGNNFAASDNFVTLSGTAPIGVKTIEVNGVSYPITWTTLTGWSVLVPLQNGPNALSVQGVSRNGLRLTNAVDTITITNTGASALLPVVINEWMADNAGPFGLSDPADGLFQDWLELFNPNADAVNLAGFHLTDNLSEPTKWQIPQGTVIAGQDFLLVWADNQPEQNVTSTNGHLHAAFQLNNGGEAVGLFLPGGVAQDVVVFGRQTQNVSQGLFPDGDTNGVYFMTNFTPRAANTLADPLRVLEISLDGRIVTLTWSAVPGRTYRILFKDSFDAPAWSLLGADVRAIGLTASVEDSMPARASRFYRVERGD